MIVPYTEFARLRVRDFWPPDAGVWKDSGLWTGIGSSDVEGVGSCFFASPMKRPGAVAQVQLGAFGPHECPVEVGDRLLRTLGLPIGPLTTASEVVDRLGPSLREPRVVAGVRYLHFEVGDRWPYRIMTWFDHAGTMLGILIARADLYRE
jgi:hypothetical protein